MVHGRLSSGFVMLAFLSAEAFAHSAGSGEQAAPPSRTALAQARLESAAEALAQDAAKLGESTAELAASVKGWLEAYASLERTKLALGDARAWTGRGFDALSARLDAYTEQMDVLACEVAQRRLGVRLYIPPATAPAGSFDDLGAWQPPLALDGEPAPEDRIALPSHLVLLIHGLDEMGCVWDFAAPRIAGAGYSVAKFDYPNDQPIARSAERLTETLRALKARGVLRVDLVGHSMGGLVAREALTAPGLFAGAGRGHADLPDVERLIMIGTPNSGSPLARFQAVTEAREQLLRLIDGGSLGASELLGFMHDGRGEAADDLLPGSAFLTELNARPLPEGVAITLVAGDAAGFKDSFLERAVGSALLSAAIGADGQAMARKRLAALADLLGDGVVSLGSTALTGVTDVVLLTGNHRSIVCDSLASPAIELILKRLSDEGRPEAP